MSALPEELSPPTASDDVPVHAESWRPFPVYERAVWEPVPPLRQRLRAWFSRS